MDKNIRKSYVFLLLGAVFISFSPVLIKDAGTPGTTTVFYRLFFGTVILFVPFVVYRLKSNGPLKTKGIYYAFIAGFCLALDMALWANGIMVSNAAMPTLVGNLAPLWVGIGAFLFYKERQSLRFWTGIIIALFGVTFLIIQDLLEPDGIFKGLIFGLFAGIFYASFMLFVQTGRKYLDTLSFLFLSTLATTVFLGIFMLAQGNQFTGFPVRSWVLFVVMGLFIQAGAWFLINFAQGYLSASIVAPTLLTQPVLAGVIAFFMLGEEPTIWQILGGIIVVIGIYTVHFSRKYQKQRTGTKAENPS